MTITEVRQQRPLRPALLLDRDGVIIANRKDYVRTPDQVEAYDQALRALAKAAHTDYLIVIITNQSAVGRGLISLGAAQRVNRQVVHEIEEAGGKIDAVFMCPHAPDDGCRCRKPRPGLILQAADKLGLDLPNSVMIGDALSDLQAGQSAGVGKTVLLRTGRGRDQATLSTASELAPFATYEDLLEAITDLLETQPENDQPDMS